MGFSKLAAGNAAAGIAGDEDDGEKTKRVENVDVEESSDEEVAADEELDAAEARLRTRHDDAAAEYEGEDVEAGEMRDEIVDGVRRESMRDLWLCR